MKTSWTFLLLWVLLVLGICVTTTENRVAAATSDAVTTAADEKSAPATADPGNPAFEKLKTLVGEWETKLPDGKSGIVSVRLASNGSALLMEMSGEEDMLTVIHPDGSKLMATHYCAAGNQPRFVSAPSSNANTVVFEFKDVTNATAEGGHMKGLIFKLVDADHHTEEWTWTQAGKEATETFALARKK